MQDLLQSQFQLLLNQTFQQSQLNNIPKDFTIFIYIQGHEQWMELKYESCWNVISYRFQYYIHLIHQQEP